MGPTDRSEKLQLAREGLPDELGPVFDALIADYKFFATIHHRSPFVSYLVLADLVRQGWSNPTPAHERGPQAPNTIDPSGLAPRPS